jgi:hypothetical protein
LICTVCQGRKTVQTVHNWSDGPGMVDMTCATCGGTGEHGDLRETLQRAVKAEAEGAEAAAQLRDLRTHLAVYFMALDGQLCGCAPVVGHTSGLTHAPHPSSYVSTWEPYLKRAAAMAPRTHPARNYHPKEVKA